MRKSLNLWLVCPDFMIRVGFTSWLWYCAAIGLLGLFGGRMVIAQDMQKAKAVIDTLCGPGFHGRGFVNEGDRKAARYLRGQFEEIGLLPLGEDYFQTFTLAVNTFPGQVVLQVGKSRLQPGTDFIANAISRGGKGKAQLLPLDTAIFSQPEAQTQFLKQNLKRKALLLPAFAFERMIELPQALIDKIYSCPVVIAQKEQKLVAALSQKALSPPYFEVLQSQLDAILQAQPASKINIKYRLDAQLVPDYETQNVIGYLPGTQAKEQYFVVSAHYDHLGQMGEGVYFPGANDNASGIAMLLELARHYARPENRPPFSLVFMAFSAEEIGLLGSLHYVKNPLFPLEQINFLVNLDLVGTGDEGAMVVNGGVLQEAFERLHRLNETHQYLPKLARRGLAANSDHYFFQEAGFRPFSSTPWGGFRRIMMSLTAPKHFHSLNLRVCLAYYAIL
ncbi:MAG: M28 family peptidase [Microscillaceae bacterium]|nr:M28 family peptidase [Microscillaceae bacterium]